MPPEYGNTWQLLCICIITFFGKNYILFYFNPLDSPSRRDLQNNLVGKGSISKINVVVGGNVEKNNLVAEVGS